MNEQYIQDIVIKNQIKIDQLMESLKQDKISQKEFEFCLTGFLADMCKQVINCIKD